MQVQGVIFRGSKRAALESWDDDDSLPPDALRGPTLYSLVSAGTETSLYLREGELCLRSGYAAVFRVEEIGSEVEGVSPGEIRFCMGNHCDLQTCSLRESLPVPEKLPARSATLARLMSVSMTTLKMTSAAPGDGVLLSGLGPVGHLAAQVFQAVGFRMAAVDPSQKRQAQARAAGIPRVGSSFEEMEVPADFQAGLGLECSGHEDAVFDLASHLDEGSELVLIGVPWRQRSELAAYRILDMVFHRYITLRSGWEWAIPRHATPLQPHSIWGNLATALDWLQRGFITTHEETFAIANPQHCHEVYANLIGGETEALFTVFDWTTG